MKSKVYGYARVSTMKQSIERQRDNILREYPNAKVYDDNFSGKTLNRESWKKLYNTVQEGDTIVFDEISRLSRNAKEGYEVYQELYTKGVNLVFLKEPHLNTSVYKDKLKDKIKLLGTKEDIILKAINEYLLEVAKEQIKIAFEQAEKERLLLSQRTKDGIRKAKANGKQIGRKNGSRPKIKKAIECKPQILKHSIDFNGTLSDKELMKMLRLSRNTFYKYKRELKANI